MIEQPTIDPPHTPVHELSAGVALHGERDHHANPYLLQRVAFEPGYLLGVEVRREVLVEHLTLTHCCVEKS